MRVSGRRLSRLELGFIAAALLLPVPLVGLNGMQLRCQLRSNAGWARS